MQWLRNNPYDPRRNLTPVVGVLMVITTVAYFLQLLGDLLTGHGASHLFALSSEGFLHGWAWQFVSYQFLHGGVWHILLNMLCLYMMGPELERVIGSARFAALYLLSGVTGGAAWLAIQYPQMGYCIGASGSIFGVMAAFATMFPRLPLSVFMFPFITLPAWVLVGILALIQLALLLENGPTQVAYAAHLAGALAGCGLAWLHKRGADPLQWVRQKQEERQVAKAQAEQADVDRILDKLAREGLHKLTEAERRHLQAASERLRAR